MPFVNDHSAPRSSAPITGLSHVQLLVSDVANSAEWYTAALGLEAYVSDLEVGYVALRHRGAGVVFVLTPLPVGAQPEVERVQTGGATGAGGGSLDHVAFAVPDGEALHSWAGHLTRIGVHHTGVVLENGNPSLQLRDPDGIAIELVALGRLPDSKAGEQAEAI